MIHPDRYRWSAVSVLAAVAVSILSTVAFVLLEVRGYETELSELGLPISALAGATVLWWRHPKTWWLVLLLYVPVMVMALLVGTIVVMGRFGYRFEP